MTTQEQTTPLVLNQDSLAVGDLVVLSQDLGIPQPHRGQLAVVYKLDERHCSVFVLDPRRRVTGECWPNYTSLAAHESDVGRLGNRVKITKDRLWTGKTGTVVLHYSGNHPAFWDNVKLGCSQLVYQVKLDGVKQPQVFDQRSLEHLTEDEATSQQQDMTQEEGKDEVATGGGGGGSAAAQPSQETAGESSRRRQEKPAEDGKGHGQGEGKEKGKEGKEKTFEAGEKQEKEKDKEKEDEEALLFQQKQAEALLALQNVLKASAAMREGANRTPPIAVAAAAAAAALSPTAAITTPAVTEPTNPSPQEAAATNNFFSCLTCLDGLRKMWRGM